MCECCGTGLALLQYSCILPYWCEEQSSFRWSEGLCSGQHVCCHAVGRRQGRISPLGSACVQLLTEPPQPPKKLNSLPNQDTHPWARGWMSACPATVLPPVHSAPGGAPRCSHGTRTRSPRSPPGTCTWERIGISALPLNKLAPGVTCCSSEGISRKHWCSASACSEVCHGAGDSSVCLAGPWDRGYVQPLFPKCCGCWSPEIYRTYLWGDRM